MKYCVLKNTVKVIDGSENNQTTMIQNSSHAGFVESEVEIITQAEYEQRLAIIPVVVPTATPKIINSPMLPTQTQIDAMTEGSIFVVYGAVYTVDAYPSKPTIAYDTLTTNSARITLTTPSTDNSGIVTYLLAYSDGTVISDPVTLPYTFPALLDFNTDYNIKLGSKDNLGQITWSDILTFHTLLNQKPIASSVNITGNATINSVLAGNYTYSDAESNIQGISTFRWFRNAVAISGATSNTYTIITADIGKTLTFEVTPIATTGTILGNSVLSSGLLIPVPTITGLTVSPTTTQNAISWNPSGITGSVYNVYWSLTTGVTKSNGTLIPNATSPYNHTGLTNGTSYFYVITETVNGIESTDSTQVSAIPNIHTGATVAPVISVVGGTNQNIISLVSAASGYSGGATSASKNLYRDSILVGVVTLPYTDLGRTNGTVYAYQLEDVDTLGAFSPKSAIVNATTNSVPVASAVSISGTLTKGSTLTGNYTYSDVNSDAQGTSTFRWLRNSVEIAGATSNTYILVDADITKTIVFEVTPKSSTGALVGIAVQSIGTVIPVPSISGLVVSPTSAQNSIAWTPSGISGATYNIYWSLTSGVTKSNGTKIANISASPYVHTGLTNSTAYYYVITEVINSIESADSIQASGTPTVSNTAPIASSVSISGTATKGSTLTGNYTYSDANSDLEGTSTFRWLRNSVAITSATAKTYVLVDADVGTNIIFEVIPVATSGVLTGIAVQSSGLSIPVPIVAGVTATTGDTLNTLTWTASGITGATYNLYWSTVTGVNHSNGTKIASITSPYSHTGRTNGTTYYYVMTEVTNGIESSDSSQVSAIPVANVPPTSTTPIISAVTATGFVAQGTINGIQAGDAVNAIGIMYGPQGTTSSDDTSAGRYVILYDAPSISAYQGAGYTFTSATLVQGTNYQVWVNARESPSNNWGVETGSTIFAMPHTIPSTPTISVASGNTQNIISLVTASTFSDSATLTGYNIYNGATKVNTTPVALPYTNTGLVNGTSYSYQIETVDSFGGVSVKSGVVSATPLYPVLIRAEQNDPAVVYTGTWTDYSDVNFSGGSGKYTSVINSTAEFTFIGTSISLYGYKWTDEGKAEIYIDDVLQTTIDCYNASVLYKTLMYQKTGLVLGTHKIKIKVLHTNTAPSSNFNIMLDYFTYDSYSSVRPPSTLSISEFDITTVKVALSDITNSTYDVKVSTDNWATSVTKATAVPFASFPYNITGLLTGTSYKIKVTESTSIDSNILTWTTGQNYAGTKAGTTSSTTVWFADQDFDNSPAGTWTTTSQGTGDIMSFSGSELQVYDATPTGMAVEQIIGGMLPINDTTFTIYHEFRIKSADIAKDVNFCSDFISSDSVYDTAWGPNIVDINNLNTTSRTMTKTKDGNGDYIFKAWTKMPTTGNPPQTANFIRFRVFRLLADTNIYLRKVNIIYNTVTS